MMMISNDTHLNINKYSIIIVDDDDADLVDLFKEILGKKWL
jgi:hypothetical protein